MSHIQSNIYASTIVIEDGEVLMIREGKNSYGQRGTWNFPSGHVELGESFTEAAIRETLEETGYEVELTGVVAIQKIDSDDTMNIVVFFSGARTGAEQAEPEEGTDQIEFVPVNDIKGLNLRFPELIEMAERAESKKIVTLDILTGGVNDEI